MKLFPAYLMELPEMASTPVKLSLGSKNFASLLAFVIALTVLNNNVYLTPSSMVLYYAVLAGGLAGAFLSAGKIRINVEMFLLYLICLGSLFFNEVPAFFKADIRFALFVGITLLIGPAVSSDFLAFFRLKLFSFFLSGIVVLTLLSFAARFVGLSHTQQGFWCGIMNHSMLLGPVAGTSALVLLADLIFGKYSGSRRNMKIACIVISLICLVGASSRTAIIATLGGALLLCGINFRFSSFFKWGVLAFIGLTLTTSLWTPLLENVERKNQNSSTFSIASREQLWQQRLEEFKEHPAWGIGFCTVDTEGGSGSTFDKESGRLEPGSSWLSILSMTGIFGAFAFLLLLNNTLVRWTKISNRRFSGLLLSLLGLLCIEMFAEGLVFASGSFLFFYLWLLFGAFEAGAFLEKREVKTAWRTPNFQSKSEREK